MSFDSRIHHRRSIRLKGYDYSQAGAYFITICCQDRKWRFGKIVVGASLADAHNADAQNAEAQMELNEYGQIAYDEWTKLPERFSNFELDVFQIMPNHMHGIILLTDIVGAGFTPAQPVAHPAHPEQYEQPQKGQPQGIVPTVNATVGDIVGAYKSLVANGCLDIFKIKWAGVNPAPYMGKLWQRNYHEHIIRNEQSYQTISNYIMNNPAKWNDDKYFME
ncbi:MAG: hypothetical protein HYZ34_03480 [Ignavibacteriae bacterium]|nr:hypothetical protein [Ignavibacteriota bacterium]